MADIFSELKEELQADRQREALMRLLPFAIGAALAAVLATAVWQGWMWQRDRTLTQAAQTYFEGARLAGTQIEANHKQAIGTFAGLADNSHAGVYRTLARLREAGLRADAGDKAGALRLWNQVAADKGAPPLQRDLADLMWSEHQLDGGDLAAATGHLQALSGEGRPFQGLAREALALAQLQAGQKDAARQILKTLAAGPGVPDGVRGRAGILLQGLGG